MMERQIFLLLSLNRKKPSNIVTCEMAFVHLILDILLKMKEKQ